MTISGFVAYVKQLWKNKPDTSTPLSAERLTHVEDGIKGNSDAIAKIAAAVVDQIVNDPNKIASMAALWAVNQEVSTLNSNLETAKTDIAAMQPVASRIVAIMPDGTSYDTLLQPGWYSMYSTVKAPGTGRFLVHVESVSSDNNLWYVVQHAYSIYGSIEQSKTRNLYNTESGYEFTPWQ